MNLQEYFQRLQEKLQIAAPTDESVSALLYEVYSETNAMYDDEIKADFHALYEAIKNKNSCLSVHTLLRRRV